jgi:perosamine synthetase
MKSRKMKIPFYKPSLGSEEINEVIDTLKSGWLTTGPKTKQFERDFAVYLKHKHAVAVNSCTAALHLALEAIGVKAGQGVIVPTMTFAATAEVVRYLGGRPILVDCRPADFNLDVADAEQKIQTALAADQPVAAIMPVHYGGQIGDVEGVQSLARRYHLKIVEDAAHCCPAFYRTSDLRPLSSVLCPLSSDLRPLTSGGNWLPVGSSADISCFSFYANKTITTGEGGMACTESDEYADRMRIMSLHGISRDAWKRYTAEGSWYYEIIAPGYKYNLTDIAAAIGIHQLRKAELFHKRRIEIVRHYQASLEDVEEIILPQAQPDRIHSWHLFVIRLRLDRLTINRSEFIDRLKEAGIATSVHYTPLHMHPYYREKFGYRPEDLPCMASVYPQIISLPIYPDLTDEEVDYVCRTIRELVGKHHKGPSAKG